MDEKIKAITTLTHQMRRKMTCIDSHRENSGTQINEESFQ